MLKEDLLQKCIIKYGLDITVKNCLFNPAFYDIRKNKLCEITLLDLGYDLNKFTYEERTKMNFSKILTRLLFLTDRNYNELKNHDKVLHLCFIKNQTLLIDFVLNTRNYFDSILMLFLAIDSQIKYTNINISLLVNYLIKLYKDYNINYLKYISKKIDPYILSQIKLHLSLYDGIST